MKSWDLNPGSLHLEFAFLTTVQIVLTDSLKQTKPFDTQKKSLAFVSGILPRNSYPTVYVQWGCLTRWSLKLHFGAKILWFHGILKEGNNRKSKLFYFLFSYILTFESSLVYSSNMIFSVQFLVVKYQYQEDPSLSVLIDMFAGQSSLKLKNPIYKKSHLSFCI